MRLVTRSLEINMKWSQLLWKGGDCLIASGDYRSYKKNPKNVGQPKKILGYFRKIIEPHGFWGPHTFEHQGHSRIHRRAPEVLVPAHQSGHQRGPQLPIACCDFQWYSKIVPINVGSLALQGETDLTGQDSVLDMIRFVCCWAQFDAACVSGWYCGGKPGRQRLHDFVGLVVGARWESPVSPTEGGGDSVRLPYCTPFGRFYQTERKQNDLAPFVFTLSTGTQAYEMKLEQIEEISRISDEIRSIAQCWSFVIIKGYAFACLILR